MNDIGQPVIVYDGECVFCQRQIERIKRRDKQERFEYVPKQTPGLDDRFPRLAEGDFNTGMRLITPTGEIHVGADAVYQITRVLLPWRLFAWLYRVPGIHAVLRLAYSWVAARRQKLGKSCADDACRVDV